MPISINGTTGLSGPTTGVHTGAVYGDLVGSFAQLDQIGLSQRVYNSTSGGTILNADRPGTILNLEFEQYTGTSPEDRYTNTALYTYQPWKSITVPQVGAYSYFKLESSIFGYSNANWGNTGFTYIAQSQNGSNLSVGNIHGTDGSTSGDSWMGFYTGGLVTRCIHWWSPFSANKQITFNWTLASWSALVTWNFQAGTSHNSTAYFSVTEIASGRTHPNPLK
jgi:hypothetical protein